MKLMKNSALILLVLGLLFNPVNTTLFAGYEAYAEDLQEAEVVETTIASIHEKYGNSTLAVKPADMTAAGYKAGDLLKVEVKGQEFVVPYGTNFSDVDTGSLVIVDDGTDVIFAINMGNIAKTYGFEVNDAVTISMSEAGGYLDEYEIHHLERTNNREDYSTDEVFANFRPVTTTGIKPGVLYRSSSPINNEIKRASYSNELISKVEGYYPNEKEETLIGVQTVLNLADTAEQIEGYAEAGDFNSEYYKRLFDNGGVKPLSMGVDVSASDFKGKLAEGIRFMIERNGPYLVHCNEGKDRAGFVSALLSALMGATHQEIVDDYMKTYENYYHIEKGTNKWNKIADSNIKLTFKTVVAGLTKDAVYEDIDLATVTKEYLKSAGLSDEEIARLKICLSDKAGTVQKIEKYGHASSDILIEDAQKDFAFGDVVTVTFDNGYTKDMPFLDGYYVDNGEHLLRAYPGHETIAVCINYGKLYEVANVGVGDRFTVSMKEKEGYLEDYLVRKLTRTDNRDDYESDAVFANFRNISYGKTKPNTLYRSSSPVDNRLKRAEYADTLMGEAGVKTVINLANKDSEVEVYLADDSFNTPNYQEIKDNGKVKALGLGLAYKSPEFKAGIIEGLKFMAANEGPYLFHCTEGKDRTGFYGALLNALMGATKEEIVADYMETYVNYYSEIKPEHNEMNSLQYRLITQDVLGMLKAIVGSDDLDAANLQEGAGRYLSSGNMTEAELTQLMKNLSTMTDAEIDQFVERVKVSELPQPTIKKGERITVGGTVYTVLDTNAKTVGLIKAKNTKRVTVPSTINFKGKTLKVIQIKANAFKGKRIRTVTIGKNVKEIKKNAFKRSKATKIVIKTKSLKKSKVKGSLKGSKVKTIQVKVGSKKVNKSYVKKYKKIFTKKNAGKKVRVLLK